jgi:hypothetical protein
MKPSCKTIQRLIMDFPDRDSLSGAQQEMLDTHLKHCHTCRLFFQEVTGILKTLQQPEVPPLPRTFFEKIRDSVLDTLEKPVPARISPREWVGRFFNAFRWRAVIAPSVCGIAGVAIGFFVAITWMSYGGIRPETVAFQRVIRKKAVSLATGKQFSVIPESDANMQAWDAIDLCMGPYDILDAVGEEGARKVLKDWEKDIPAEVYDLIVS